MFKKQKIHMDSKLGEFKHGHHNHWDGFIDLDADYRGIPLSIEGDKDRPEPVFLEKADSLPGIFAARLPRILECLQGAYQRYYLGLEKEGWHKEMPAPDNVKAGDLFTLVNVFLGANITLVFCFRDSLDDALFEVLVDKDSVTCANMGD